MSVEEPIAITIESLRARLLSERSVSKNERQRADELAQRVSELEEQLKVASLQRKKAEMATADLLSILANHGISDLSEGFDSNSEHDGIPHNFTTIHSDSMTIRDASTNRKLTTNGPEAFSSSEFESSQSTGRILSWKSNKNSQHYLQKKTYTELVRREASFASNSNSPSARRIGKSCRRIRRREPRSLDESQNEGYENARSSVDVSNCSDGASVARREGSDHDNGAKQPGNPLLGSNAGNPNNHYFGENMNDDEILKSLEHRYDQEKKGDNEWDENDRGNDSAAHDSCDPGNHSDITEERYETESPELSSATTALNSDHQEKRQGAIDVSFSVESQISDHSHSITHPHKENLQDEKQQRHAARNSSASEFSSTILTEKSDLDLPGKSNSLLSGKSSSDLNLAVADKDISDNVASVLEALQQAKLFLNQKHHSSFPAAGGTTSSNILKRSGKPSDDSSSVQFTAPVLFRLPTDYEFEATTRADRDQRPTVRSSFGTGYYPPAMSNSGFLSNQSNGLGSSSSPGQFHTALHGHLAHEIQLELASQWSFSMPRQSDGLTTVKRTSHLSDSYPFVPDITLGLPLNEEWDARRAPSSESGLPPFKGQFIHDHFRPDMYM